MLIGLSESPRWLPCQYLYDARGSELFEQITELPEYYPTRTEAGILGAAAPQIAETVGPATLIELGSGSSAKTELLLSAFASLGNEFTYVPVDVSAAALEGARERIEAVHPLVHVTPFEGVYQQVFPHIREHAPCLVAFLGSTLGNFNQGEAGMFWSRVARAMGPGDHFLLGVDLVKDAAIIEAAYNDAAGITAQFTKNLFVRMNRELAAGIDIESIEPEAQYNEAWQRVEIVARFTRPQVVSLEPLGVEVPIGAGEPVMVEISRKFVLPDVERYVSAFGFETKQVFTDQNEWCAVLLLERSGTGDGGTAEGI